ncbi:STAS domain-containing protein [Streptomyces boncukensis]|uniref:STAS domain-containing protein n=1 Tax=Streptomyces boncukensis TaxID=2711219 RepID=A0A6G4X5A1_9ACTN|nr:STAS domain-containing protein [Streptomyces boncukensis]NGO72312.1 STAS domain-containing protein [Streptomyces boncukensis]
MSLTCRWSGADVLVIDAPGRFDEVSAPLLCGPVLRFVHAGQLGFVVDFSAVEHLDRSAVPELERLRHTVRARGGTLAVAGDARVRSALRTQGVEHAGLVYDTVAEAAEACRGGIVT